MIVRQIVWFGRPAALACDAVCTKAWGINNRPQVDLSEREDDYAFLADGELGDAPDDPGTYEGGDGKPRGRHERLNKWCARECERSVVVDVKDGVEALPDFSGRVVNIPDEAAPWRKAGA